MNMCFKSTPNLDWLLAWKTIGQKNAESQVKDI